MDHPLPLLLFITEVSALSAVMDSQNSNLTCIICLERFRIPVTIPCGHTFCQACITMHWDTKSRCDIGPQCPICNEKFATRPILKRNVSLSVLTEAANSSSHSCRELHMRGSEGARAMQLCDRHKKPLVYYCRQDRTSVCCECGISTCESHDKVLLEAERETQEVKQHIAITRVDPVITLSAFLQHQRWLWLWLREPTVSIWCVFFPADAGKEE